MTAQGHQMIVAGAEILTNLDYLQVYALAGQKYLLTNGILLSQDVNLPHKLIACGIEEVCISWHIGSGDILSSISDDVIETAIYNCLKAGLKAKVSCVLCNRNYNLLANEIVPRVQTTGVNALRLFQLMPVRAELKQYQLTAAQKEEVLRVVKQLREFFNKFVFRIEVQGSFGATKLTEKRRLASRNGLFCPAGKTLVVVETDNQVYPCPFLTQSQFRMGYWENGQLNIERKFSNDGTCCVAEKLLCRNETQ